MMTASQISRRNWLKKGGLTLAGLTMIPSEIWANTVEIAQKNKNKFLFNSFNTFNEFTPPFRFELKLKAVLRSNENPYGPSPLAAKAFQDATFSGNRYSWNALVDLVTEISKKENVQPTQILMGPGSTDILEKVAVLMFQNGGDVISADPSYMTLINVSKSVGGTWKSYKLLDDSQHDLDAMEAGIDANTKLVYICNPNNPSGSITNAKRLKDFCSRVSEKVPVFIDEAYIELSDNGMKDSMVSLVSEGKNVMVARTFSKIHGMAGLRIGYLLGREDIINKVKQITTSGMGITGPSIMAAKTSLNGHEFLTMSRNKIIEAKNYTTNYLKQKNYLFLPSQTNFIVFEIPMDGNIFLEKIYDKQVAVRAFTFWNKNWCRVSIGTMTEMQLFTKVMDEIFV